MSLKLATLYLNLLDQLRDFVSAYVTWRIGDGWTVTEGWSLDAALRINGKCPHAVKLIDRLNELAYDVHDLIDELSDPTGAIGAYAEDHDDDDEDDDYAPTFIDQIFVGERDDERMAVTLSLHHGEYTVFALKRDGTYFQEKFNEGFYDLAHERMREVAAELLAEVTL